VASDIREAILSRLPVLLGGMPGIVKAYRNRGELTEESLKPAVITLDGEEDIRTRIDDRQRAVPGVYPPAVFTLRPQIFVLLKKRDRIDNLTLQNNPAPVGPELSGWRNAVFSAVTQDPTLLGLVGSTGRIEYLGSETDMRTGSTIGVMGAQLWLKFAFSYVLNPSQLS
jgi:hypothetical protein